jgi:hypothetical protein
MKKELKDYSGPYNHHLKWEDFSKEFLVKLLKSWQGAYLGIQGDWIQVVSEKYGSEAGDACALEALLLQADRMIPQWVELGNIKLNTVLDSLKVIQLAPDGHTEFRALRRGSRDQEPQPCHIHYHQVHHM